MRSDAETCLQACLEAAIMYTSLGSHAGMAGKKGTFVGLCRCLSPSIPTTKRRGVGACGPERRGDISYLLVGPLGG